MAVPAAPANLTVKPGPHPNSITVNADAVSATPTVLDYSVYIQSVTGVNKTAGNFDHKKTSTKPDVVIEGIREMANHFVTITARNSEDESVIAAEVKHTPRR